MYSKLADNLLTIDRKLATNCQQIFFKFADNFRKVGVKFAVNLLLIFGKLLANLKKISCCFLFFRGLWHLHEQNVVHADVKPSNVLLSADRKVVKLRFRSVPGENDGWTNIHARTTSRNASLHGSGNSTEAQSTQLQERHLVDGGHDCRALHRC